MDKFCVSNLLVLSLLFFCFGCNSTAAKEEKVDVPVIIGPWPESSVPGGLGVFRVSLGETLTTSVLFTPSKNSVAVWYLDDAEIARGKDLSYKPSKEGEFKLRLEVRNKSGVASKEARLVVTSPSGSVTFNISRGVNIGNWLSQSKVRGTDRDKAFTEKHVKLLAEAGFDHLRLPVDEEQLFKEDGSIDREVITMVKRTIDYCANAGMRVLFDLHIIKAHNFDNSENPLWTVPAEQDRLLEMWKQIDDELKSYSPDLLAYEFLNEPVAPDDKTWSDLYNRFISQVRSTDKDRILVIEANKWGGVKYVSRMDLPDDDQNIIIQIHYYEPMLLTHYQASWNKYAKLHFDSPLTYPGVLVSDAQYASLTDEEKDIVRPFKKYYDINTITAAWKDAIDFAKKKGLRLYLGEFGCLPNCGAVSRNAWTRDVVSVCLDNGISYSYWEFNHSFGFADRNGTVTNPELVEILTGRKYLR